MGFALKEGVVRRLAGLWKNRLCDNSNEPKIWSTCEFYRTESPMRRHGYEN
jgi:hypothetical protein